jgi:hypothetical protein
MREDAGATQPAVVYCSLVVHWAREAHVHASDVRKICTVLDVP